MHNIQFNDIPKGNSDPEILFKTLTFLEKLWTQKRKILEIFISVSDFVIKYTSRHYCTEDSKGKLQCCIILSDNNEAASHNLQLQDVTDQESEFAEMANELADFKGSNCTFRMYLQYCPEAVTYLLDRCLVIECAEQVTF